MDWALAGSGIAIGVAVAAPIGPINLMCIQQTLGRGMAYGVFTGLGAVLGDGTFAAVAAFGLTAISQFVLDYVDEIQIVGGLAMLLIGLRTIFVPPRVVGGARRAEIASHMSVVGATYFLTISNPATMLGFAAIFGGFGNVVNPKGDYAAAALLVAAIMAGSLLWWIVLSWLVSLFKRSLSNRGLRIINIGSGLVIAAFGGVVLARVLLM